MGHSEIGHAEEVIAFSDSIRIHKLARVAGVVRNVKAAAAGCCRVLDSGHAQLPARLADATTRYSISLCSRTVCLAAAAERRTWPATGEGRHPPARLDVEPSTADGKLGQCRLAERGHHQFLRRGRVMSVTGQTIDEVVGFYAFDGRAEAVAGMDAGGGEVRVFAVGPGSVVQTASFQAYEESFLGGVRVAALATTEPGGSQYQIVTVPGAGRPLELRAWAIAGDSAALVRAVPLTGPEYQLGAFVDVADIDGDGQLDAVLATDRGVATLVGALTTTAGSSSRSSSRSDRTSWAARA